jgi:hypothetical protein
MLPKEVGEKKLAGDWDISCRRELPSLVETALTLRMSWIRCRANGAADLSRKSGILGGEMNDTVVWRPTAERTLAQIRTAAIDRQAIADAADSIDAMLGLDRNVAIRIPNLGDRLEVLEVLVAAQRPEAVPAMTASTIGSDSVSQPTSIPSIVRSPITGRVWMRLRVCDLLLIYARNHPPAADDPQGGDRVRDQAEPGGPPPAGPCPG